MCLVSVAFAAPNAYGGYGAAPAPQLFSAPAPAAYAAPAPLLKAAPAYEEIHSRELTGYRQEVLNIPEVHTESRALPSHVEIVGQPYDVPTLHQETRAYQTFRYIFNL